MSDITNFSTEPIKWFFSIDGNPYVLKEASEDAYTAYRNVTMMNLHVTEGKGGSFTGGAEADTVLVQKCLFRIEPASSPEGSPREVPVNPMFVKGLKRSITSRLYQWIKKNSGMEEEEETIEVLEKRIKSDQAKLVALKSGETSGKDGSSSTESI